MRSKAEECAQKMFLGDVEGHRMTVLKDEGLYRHVRFGKPNGSSMYRFDLVTWPGHLVITGDFQDYHFARIADMFQFFRDNPDRGTLEINAHYWAEKLVGHHQQYQRFSPERYRQLVVEHFREFCSTDDHPHHELWTSIHDELLDDAETIDDNEAHRRLQDFRYDLMERVEATRYRDGIVRVGATFEFTDSWEWDLRDYDHHYLVSLYAIVWGISQWDSQPHKTEAEWLREDLSAVRKELRETSSQLEMARQGQPRQPGGYQSPGVSGLASPKASADATASVPAVGAGTTTTA